MKYKAAIFDMDGTILDTIEDLANSVIYTMKKEGHRHDFSVGEVRQFFGSGALVAFERALAYEAGEELDHLKVIGTTDSSLPDGVREDEAKRLVEVFSDYYPDHCEECTKAFEGIHEVLSRLRDAGIRLAVVSNKIDPAVQVLANNHFPNMFDFAIGQSSEQRRKPFPDMLEKCLEVLGADCDEAVYIGDSEIDIQTAANAGIPCISVAWGFRSREFLLEHGATGILESPEELAGAILE